MYSYEGTFGFQDKSAKPSDMKKKILQVILTWIIIIGCAINSENVSTINCMPTEKYSMTKTVQATAVSTQTRKESTS